MEGERRRGKRAGGELEESKKESLMNIIQGFFSENPLLQGCTLLNLYMFGSHLHGCAGPHSDFDFVCVVGGVYFPGIRRVSNEEKEKDEVEEEQIISEKGNFFNASLFSSFPLRTSFFVPLSCSAFLSFCLSVFIIFLLFCCIFC